MTGNDLIGTPYGPPYLRKMRRLAQEARAYHSLQPYPWFHFNDWRTEQRGPLPRCVPFPSTIVKRSARWLFGKPLTISVPDSKTTEKNLTEAWEANRMPNRMKAAALQGGQDGSLFLAWNYDKSRPIPLMFNIWLPAENVELFFDPMDSDRLLMARIQYCYYDAATNSWWWYREEWTDDLIVKYKPVKATHVYDERNPYAEISPPRDATFEVDSSNKNPAQIIPGVLVKNQDIGAEIGVGDLWGVWRVVDRINLTYHLMDRSNQFDSEPMTVFMNSNLDADDQRPIAPGEKIVISDIEEGKKADVKQLEASGNLRPAMMEYAKTLERQVFEFSGSSMVDPSTITNKGALSGNVMRLLYSAQIETTEDKRQLYGEDGIGKLLENACEGLSNMGVKGFKAGVDVQIIWPDHFDMTDEEKLQRLTVVSMEVEKGFLPKDRAVQQIAQMEGIRDVQTLKDELDEQEEAAAEDAANQTVAGDEKPEENEPDAKNQD